MLSGIMDVSSIKGLTMPITMVIPPRALTEGIDQTSEEDLSLFLVQITRAQYMNVILEDPRKIDEYKDVSILNYPDPKNPHEKGIKSENVSSWLDDILNNSAGFDYSFSNLFERTLGEYTSETLWNRLVEESATLEDEIHFYIQWLKELFARIVEPGGTKLASREFSNEFFTSDEKFLRGSETNNKVELSKVKESARNYLLGEHLEHLSALKLFLTINTWLRPKFHRSVQPRELKNSFELWVDEISEDDDDLDYNESMMKSWLKLICEQKHEPSDEICKNLEETFGLEKAWPQTPLPRLPMGPWRIKKPPHDGNAREEDGKDYNPWMDEGSQFYNIHPDVLDKGLIRGTGDLEYYTKIKLFLGMISQQSSIFCSGMMEVLTSEDEFLRMKLLDWYVDMFESREQHEAFKDDVSEELEKRIISKKEGISDYLTEFLKSAETIARFEQMVRAFSFKEWQRCVHVPNLFEGTISLTHSYIEDLNNKNISGTINSLEKELKEERKDKDIQSKIDSMWAEIADNHEIILKIGEHLQSRSLLVSDPPADDFDSHQEWLERYDLKNLNKYGDIYRESGIFDNIRVVLK